uniref:Uncharacterized protein n=1 Tax=Anguilla anguilla TaxID=7936 RepID=A0A0E9U2Y5_ANGAN
MTTLLDLSVFIIKRKHRQLYDSAKYCLLSVFFSSSRCAQMLTGYCLG